MARLPRLSLLVVLTGLSAACAEGHAMNTGAREMSAALAEADTENERHAAACEGASSTGEMAGELDLHESSMDDIMERMVDARERMRSGSMMRMERCSGASFDHMSGTLEDAHSEMSRHSERMRTAESLDAARSECASHTDSMRAMMEGMMDDLDSMPCTHG